MVVTPYGKLTCPVCGERNEIEEECPIYDEVRLHCRNCGHRWQFESVAEVAAAAVPLKA